jgi:hypothetical protein
MTLFYKLVGWLTGRCKYWTVCTEFRDDESLCQVRNKHKLCVMRDFFEREGLHENV